MVNPKDLDVKAVQKKLKELGIDMATLERVAHIIEDQVPELKTVLNKQAGKKGFESTIDGLYEDVKDVFDNDHEATPDGEK